MDQKVDFVNAEREIFTSDIVSSFKIISGVLKKYFFIIIIVSLVGGLTGFVYGYLAPTNYVAKLNFVLENDNKAGLGQYSSLASIAGIDLNNGGGDIFQNDNIIELYKSRLMIEKTLLSKSKNNSSQKSLIERFIAANHLREKWSKKNGLSNINFNGDPSTFNRQQDSIITDIVNLFNKSYLKVSKPDRKLSIIEVSVTLTDELLAKDFANTIASNVNTFYIQTKTKKLLQNVNVLQQQVDSVRNVLNRAMYGVANAADASPNANPLVSVLRVPSQRKQIDVQTSSSIYTEVLKNLELTKIQLRNETPLIQIIDSPVLPLSIVKIGKLKALVVGFFLAFAISTTLILLKFYFFKTVSANK